MAERFVLALNMSSQNLFPTDNRNGCRFLNFIAILCTCVIIINLNFGRDNLFGCNSFISSLTGR